MVIVTLIPQDSPEGYSIPASVDLYLSRVPCIGEEVFVSIGNSSYTTQVSAVQHIPCIDPSASVALVYVIGLTYWGELS